MTVFATHGIDHLSASNLNLWIAQPAMWAASYLMKRRTPVGPAAHRGTAIECGVEAGLFDPSLPVAECQKIALERYHGLTRLSSDQRIEKERDSIAPSVEVALRELRQYGPPDKPDDGRQHKIEIILPGIPIPIIGFLDFRWSSHGIIGDLKTTARIPSAISDAHARQGAIYTRSGSNMQTRMCYVSAKKIAVYVVDDVDYHLGQLTQAAQSIERFLSLSDDSEKLTKCFAPDLSSFYWGDSSARAIAHEIWGLHPNSAPSAFPMAAE